MNPADAFITTDSYCSPNTQTIPVLGETLASGLF